MDVSVIIVNCNTCTLTCNCIDSIYEKTYNVSYEVIVVDNDSTDGSQEKLSKDKRIIFIESGSNLGYGRANNLGFEKSKGKYVFLLNSDTYLVSNAIKEFYDKMEQCSPMIACIGCLLKDAEGNTVHSYANFPRVENAMRSYVSNKLFKLLGFRKWEMDPIVPNKNDNSFFKVEYVTGADLFIRRAVIDELGLFDPDFFMYSEDPELQWRYLKNGYSSYILTTPIIVHLEGKSRKSGKNAIFLMKLESLMLYLKKTQDSFGLFFFKILLVLKLPYTTLVRRFVCEECKRYIKIVLNK